MIYFYTSELMYAQQKLIQTADIWLSCTEYMSFLHDVFGG